MSTLDRDLLRRFLELAGDRLRGSWVVIGGCVPLLLDIGTRPTADIDIAGPDEAGMDATITLMEIAESLGLPVEAVNQAGAFFLRRIDGWRDRLIEVHKGTTATILVPDATLFVLLKIKRLSEADLGDCLCVLDYARERGEDVDARRIRAAAAAILGGEHSQGHEERIKTLLTSVHG